jgi:hypothetical protein
MRGQRTLFHTEITELTHTPVIPPVNHLRITWRACLPYGFTSLATPMLE